MAIMKLRATRIVSVLLATGCVYTVAACSSPAAAPTVAAAPTAAVTPSPAVEAATSAAAPSPATKATASAAAPTTAAPTTAAPTTAAPPKVEAVTAAFVNRQADKTCLTLAEPTLELTVRITNPTGSAASAQIQLSADRFAGGVGDMGMLGARLDRLDPATTTWTEEALAITGGAAEGAAPDSVKLPAGGTAERTYRLTLWGLTDPGGRTTLRAHLTGLPGAADIETPVSVCS
jgi:hypothetical protein